jgi:hypothetical protein
LHQNMLYIIHIIKKENVTFVWCKLCKYLIFI